MNTYTYTIGNSLYVNLTNRCDMNCTFCIRNEGDALGDADSLWLDHEGSREEVLSDITSHDLSRYDEVVFCGYGEPTMRLDDMLWICDQLKKLKDAPKIRLNTNGHACLIAGEDVTPLFAGRFDTVSISLNASNAQKYTELCRPAFGEDAYFAMLDFTKKVKEYVGNTILSVVSVIGEEEIERCRKIADECGVPLRVRIYS